LNKANTRVLLKALKFIKQSKLSWGEDVGRRGWGQKTWIISYWLKRMKNPFEEAYSIRQAFYKELPQIVKIVPENIIENTKDWAATFYNKMCAYLSGLVLDGKASYEQINIYDDSGASQEIWQDYQFVEKRPPIGEGFVVYPIEVWVENNASYNSLRPLFQWTGKGALVQLNFISQRGFANTQQIERLVERAEDVKVILNLTDFDPSGYYMPQDLQNRCKRIGLNVELEHIGILPGQIPTERRAASLITYKRNDPRCKRFRLAFPDDPMVQDYHGYEIQALSPSEIRELVTKSIERVIKI